MSDVMRPLRQPRILKEWRTLNLFDTVEDADAFLAEIDASSDYAKKQKNIGKQVSGTHMHKKTSTLHFLTHTNCN